MKSCNWLKGKWSGVHGLSLALIASIGGGGANPAAAEDGVTFNMVRAVGLVKSGCLPEARATVNIQSEGAVEYMRVRVEGLPPNTDFDFFVIQDPVAPFGLSWYQGDIQTDAYGNGSQSFVGRFSIETFIVAPGEAPAPVVFQNAFPDTSSNPATSPVHQYHLGLWFNNPANAVKAGCPGTVTPFNGTHNAGIQVLNTSNFPELEGPLSKVH